MRNQLSKEWLTIYDQLNSEGKLEAPVNYDDIFNGEETLDFNVYFNIERVDEEITDYSLVIDTPKINMHNVKALLIHNFVNEEAYPSVGIFDSPKELQENSKDKIVLNGHIQTINDISNTKFKLYLEYTDDNNDLNKIYYEVNRG